MFGSWHDPETYTVLVSIAFMLLLVVGDTRIGHKIGQWCAQTSRSLSRSALTLCRWLKVLGNYLPVYNKPYSTNEGYHRNRESGIPIEGRDGSLQNTDEQFSRSKECQTSSRKPPHAVSSLPKTRKHQQEK